ncbi:hypothetical protein [Pseudarthrobacter sp. C4D7]|uniref:hypothetical protein n=1 Tax=Pseudarthrobacter sp. C4D7 TaxID=2735268 RepID=UPI001584C13A|nr:hypothetical protein [Pseudarthrobacter sp. C4D7]NUT69575.1 hypothetical protein [Pseudarthrobacter sp. C4D7]
MAIQDSVKPGTARNQGLWQRRTWLLVVVAGFIVYILGFVIGLQPSGPLCGSPLLRDSHAAELMELQQAGIGAAAACYRSIDSESVPVWTLMAVGVAVVMAGVAARIISIRRAQGSAGVE